MIPLRAQSLQGSFIRISQVFGDAGEPFFSSCWEGSGRVRPHEVLVSRDGDASGRPTAHHSRRLQHAPRACARGISRIGARCRCSRRFRRSGTAADGDTLGSIVLPACGCHLGLPYPLASDAVVATDSLPPPLAAPPDGSMQLPQCRSSSSSSATRQPASAPLPQPQALPRRHTATHRAAAAPPPRHPAPPPRCRRAAVAPIGAGRHRRGGSEYPKLDCKTTCHCMCLIFFIFSFYFICLLMI
jgi:hypothetical protein